MALILIFFIIVGIGLLLFGVTVVMHLPLLNNDHKDRLISQIMQQKDKEQLIRREQELAYASVAHDLDVSVNAVKTYTGLLKEKLGGLSESETGNVGLEIMKTADRMHEMIGYILDISKVQKDSLRQTVNMTTVMADVIDELSMTFPFTKPQWHIERLEPAFGDASQIRQIVKDIFLNTMTYDVTRQPKIRVASSRVGNYVKYTFVERQAGFNVLRTFGILPRVTLGMEKVSRGEDRGGLPAIEDLLSKNSGWILTSYKTDAGSRFSFTLRAND